MHQYKGLVAASVSPFTEEGNVDVMAIERLVEYYVERGFTGAFFMSSVGEYFSSSPEKRRIAASTAALCAKGRLTIFTGVSEDYIEGVYENIDRMAQTGVNALMLMPPRFITYSQEELIHFYTLAADYSPLPLFIYNHMTRLPNKLEVSTVERLSHHPNIYGIKDTHNEHARLTAMLSTFKNRDDFLVYSGGDGISGLTCLMGGYLLNALSPVCPDVFLEMMVAGRNQDVDRVMELQGVVNSLSRIFNAIGGGKIAGLSPFTQGVKAALQLKGLCGTHLAQLGLTVTDEDLERIRTIVHEALGE